MDRHEERLQEAEIRMAFLERELETYKDAVGLLHDRLTRLEKQLQELKENAESARGLEDFWKPEEP